MDDSGPVSLGVDVGGTFTDVVLRSDGRMTTTKVLTTDQQSEGVLAGIEAACEAADVEPEAIDQFRHAMTVGTNALLEGTGARVALITTEGFADVIEIGRQNRPALYDPTVDKPDPLVPPERRHEIAERATPDGIETTLERGGETDEKSDLERESVDEIDSLVEAIDSSTDSIAISLLHAYAHPENERALTGRLRESLDARVFASHETLPEFREYERTATTVVDAYLTPVIDSYLGHLIEACRQRDIKPPAIMQSNGGIADADTVREHAVTTVLSGPAAGVVGASLFDDDGDGVITFDMGGTSSDVGLLRDGEIRRTSESTVGGYPVHVPMVDVETVGAGGGSIAWVDAGGALRVGPDSAGASPGPVCYGRGGTKPTVTDAALVLGYLGSETSLGDTVSLDASGATRALSDLADRAGLATEIAAARGVERVATATTARTVRRVTLERGHDPRQFTLVAFGGAGPMLACSLADRLDIDRIRVPKATGVLSALGLLAADERHDASRTVRANLDDVEPGRIASEYDQLLETLDRSSSRDERSARETTETHIERAADLRYEGQSHELTVGVADSFDASEIADRFHALHERSRGYRLADEPIELVTLRVTISQSATEPTLTHRGSTAEPMAHRDVFFTEKSQQTPIYRREHLPSGMSFEGPAICEGGESTVIVHPDWRASVDDQGTLTLEAKQ